METIIYHTYKVGEVIEYEYVDYYNTIRGRGEIVAIGVSGENEVFYWVRRGLGERPVTISEYEIKEVIMNNETVKETSE
jgi:hypothetical protein